MLTIAAPGSPRTFSTRWISRRCRFPTNGDVTRRRVFAGYGIVVPEGQEFAYDSYATLDDEDGRPRAPLLPRGCGAETKAILARYADLSTKHCGSSTRPAKAMLM